jgi:hypothetical protein
MKDYPIGTIITGRPVMSRRWVKLLLSVALAGTAITVNDQHAAPKPLFGPKLPTQHVGHPGAGGGGGGTILIGN